MVDDANRVLGPSLGIKLQIVATEPWLPPSGEDDLLQALNDLTAADRGDDVDWVVAVLGASHGFEVSFKKLGYTRHLTSTSCCAHRTRRPSTTDWASRSTTWKTCTDIPTLEGWMDRVLTARTAADVFG